MGVPQMYYTSCEVGLAGYPGFQFNAATPGVDDGVLRRVERATSYEPPRSLGYQPTADPIDFWRAAFWSHTEATGTELSEVDPVPSAPIGPAAADAFLQQSGRLGWLPRMLTAVERAIVTGDRPVIIVERDSERVARWVAAISQLLPPPIALRLSFATYSFRPGRGTEHLVGTVPETDFVVDDSALRSYSLFDTVGGRASEGTGHPLAELLAAVGPEDARALWARAERLGSGAERDFADWYPLAVAGALGADLPVGAGDLAAVLEWLPGNLTRLRPDVVVDVADRCLYHDALTVSQSVALIEVAAAVRDDSLRTAAEICAFKLLVRDPSAAPPRIPKPATEAGVRHATSLVTAGLSRAGRSRDALVLLSVAIRAGLPLDDGDLEAYGRDLIAPMLLDTSDTRPPEAVAHSSALRRGMLAGLVDALETRESAVLAVATHLDGVVPERELDAHPRLRRLLLVARAARDPEQRVPALRRICQSGEPDRAVLNALWPDPWTFDDAVEVVTEAPELFRHAPALVDRLDQVLVQPAVPKGRWKDFYGLCEFVVKRKLDGRLSPASAGHVAGILEGLRLFETADAAKGRRAADYVHKVLDHIQDGEWPLVRGWYEGQLPFLLVGLAATQLAEVLPDVPGNVRVDYRGRAAERLRRRPADLDLAATVLEARLALSRRRPGIAGELDEVLSESVARWKSRDLDQLEKWVAESGVKGLSLYYKQWRESQVPRGIGRFLPRRRH